MPLNTSLFRRVHQKGMAGASSGSSSRNAGLIRGCSAAALACLSIGVLVIAAGLILPSQIDRKLQAGVLEAILWTPQSPPATDARYRNNTAPGAPPAYFRVWLFNITNLHDVRQGAKPILEQVGPYVYRGYHERHQVMWSADGRVHFKDHTYFKLDSNLTAADPDAPIATFNLPLLGVLAALHGNVSPGLLPFVDLLMKVLASYREEGLHGLFAVRNATDLLWGYEDKLLQLLEKLVPAGTLPNGATVSLLSNSSSLEAALARNATTVNTGELDLSRLWTVEADQGRTEVKSWPCPEPVQGGDATQFKPGLTAADRLTVWVGDIYQSADLIVNSSTELHGVKLLRYWLDPAQAAPNPCHNQELTGLMNITGPQAAGWDGPSNASGPAVFVSMPMFCGADERLVQEVDGLECDWERHMTWVDVEPTTGITLRAFKRMMMSSRIGGLGSVLEQHVAPNLTIPIFWAEESGEAPQELAQQFKSTLYRAQWMVANLAKVCWIAGGCCMLCGIVLAVLTVQLAADPDKWQPVAADESAIAAARDMLYNTRGSASRVAGAAAWRPGDVQQQQQGGAPFGPGGGVIAVAAAGDGAGNGAASVGDEEEGDVERQGLLSRRVGGAAGEDGEIGL
ncbi:hypothetical protein OEZ85_013054 [Tetradesmus obliquus]|uniref:Uncharacterized protein n=1 Tax=Tetradesmus obliquus TaxID=3088 RepID=A0ABY8U7E1_TETOB|nr:hypothetical protein OEZ85_013054 [Tetradesmus obliquus]